MLSKSFRLSKNNDIKKVFKTGKGAKFGFLIIRWLKNSHNISRFAFVVSNKISNKATVRQLLKRRLRESVGLKLKIIESGYDCVILANSGIQEKTFKEIDKNIIGLLIKSNLMKKVFKI